LWATFGLFTKKLYAVGYTPTELASVRAFVGLIGALVVALVRGPRRLAIPPRALLFFALYGVLGFALFEYIFFAVLNRTTIAVGVALLYTAPAFVLIFSRVVWRESVPRWKWIALVMVLIGVVLVTGAADASLTAIPAPVIALGLFSGAAYAGYTLFSKKASETYDSLQSLFWSFLFAALAFGIIAPPIEPLLRDPDVLPTLLGLGIVPTLLPYGLYLIGLRYLRASTASMLASVEPMVATILAAIVLGEGIGVTRIAGIVFIVAAAALLAFESTTRAGQAGA
jgi:drug/metabolite transporter (DMT)-like permease